MSESSTISPRREKTRQRLMAAAASVIAENGFAAASVEEICDRAGFTRGAFYSNFDTKDDLALAMLRANAERHLAGAQVAIDQAGAVDPADDRVDDLVVRAVDTFVASQPREREQVLLEAELQLHAVRNPDFGDAYARFGAEMTQLFADTIGATLHARGLELAIEPARAVDLLRAVHTTSSLDAMLGGGCPTPQGASLKTMLLALVRSR